MPHRGQYNANVETALMTIGYPPFASCISPPTVKILPTYYNLATSGEK
ncbi:hypothetical protein SpAn4DRAFT_3367 [Sporomusa ovata]|uniref:Uncharacterized protein n=1 Tax=Sporomusa ovata TaxID=2378 RepID=A0A0U1KZQ8_9FIRM|nr:hypothetical protein SpAn4DRAFT_3367 [Sporomusa ovata]